MDYLLRLLLVTILMLPVLTACETVGNAMSKAADVVTSPFGESEEEEEERLANEVDPTAEQLYGSGKLKFDKGNYKGAITQFEEIERLYPFSPLAPKAKMMVAYAHYRDREYDDAILAMDNFIRLHPGNQHIAYIYYLKALSYYDRIADVKHDQGVTEMALASLKEVITRFPDSKYARDARLKIDLVRDHLAGQQMTIGRFYLKDKKFLAAINRFRKVIDDYQDTSHIEEALYRMVECYLSLGIVPEAKKHASVLGHNYPSSKWYHYAFALLGENVDGAPKPAPTGVGAWFSSLIEEEEPQPLPKDDNAKTWLDEILSVFE